MDPPLARIFSSGALRCAVSFVAWLRRTSEELSSPRSKTGGRGIRSTNKERSDPRPSTPPIPPPPPMLHSCSLVICSPLHRPIARLLRFVSSAVVLSFSFSPFVLLYAWLSVSVLVCLCACLYVMCRSVCLYICLSVRPCVLYMCVCLSVCMYVCLHVCM